MSAGGSKTTESKPEIPPELQDLLTKRTDLEGAQIQDLGALFTGAAAGQSAKTLPYTSAVLKPFTEAAARASSSIPRVTGTSGNTNELLEQARRAIGAQQEKAQAVSMQDVLGQLLTLIGSQPYPIGETKEQYHSPGIADYLQTVSNVGKAAATVVAAA